MSVNFSASMMCANYACLEKEIEALEAGGIDSFHIDIMDGIFVNNFGMGIHDLRYIRSATKKPVDVHLMIKEPIRFLDVFAEIGVDTLYIHPESQYHTSTTVEEILNRGMNPAIAINPGTSAENILELLNIVKRVLVMTVNPGHAGRLFQPYVGNKITKLLRLQKDYDFEIYWDGNCTVDKVETYAPMGVTGFVLGTASLFNKNRPYAEIIKELRGKTI
ncbi:MAG: ribulose-phosphate 3-epimerase [Ruminococcus sp.]|jgi:ribulose-phosphate 3-epimerase|nr:ribulose-phosphate 3-epimerase [Ruminococcus sp.]